MAGPTQDQLFLLAIVGTTGVLFLAIFIIFIFFIYQKRMFAAQQQKQQMELEFQQRMAQLHFESQEQERTRIASDLHDSLGSLLWGAKVNASFVERSLPMNPQIKEAFTEITKSLDTAAHTIRRIAWELTPEAFHHSGLSASLMGLCQGIDGKGITVTLNETGHSRIWNTDRALQIFRIAQELISNCVKHAKATTIQINLHWTEKSMTLEVTDNGIGFNLHENRRGVGWWNIQHRVNHIHAQINIGHPPIGTGTQITILVPFDHEK